MAEKMQNNQKLTPFSEMEEAYPTVYAAWQMFARFDKNAKNLKVWIRFLRTVALVVGVLAPLLAILDLVYEGQTEVFRHMIIVLPILLSALLTASNRLERGGKWFILRAAAERVKREIYSYRVGIGKYQDEAIKDENLAKSLDELYRRLMETKV
ncbi:MAG TPA: DUF4231 domain-containing protein, partial [Anaerolineales bacterium]|nr:DUF4231 domain-containing protein [Anaerolineales bacterium]